MKTKTIKFYIPTVGCQEDIIGVTTIPGPKKFQEEVRRRWFIAWLDNMWKLDFDLPGWLSWPILLGLLGLSGIIFFITVG